MFKGCVVRLFLRVVVLILKETTTLFPEYSYKNHIINFLKTIKNEKMYIV